MADVPRPAWLTELIEVSRQLYEVSGGDKGLLEGGRLTRLGRANQDPESDPGWFWVDLGGQAAEPEQLESAFLAPAEGSRQRQFQVMEAMQEGDVLRVKVASFAPADGQFLWAPRDGSARLAKALLDGLTQISRFDLVERFGQGRADPVPDPAPEAVPSGGLDADQARGLAACLAPGVQLVWGPPGTGKTKLISAALQDLIGRGQSVLLVSGTDAAVDSAVGLAAGALDPAPGVLVRAGMSHVPDIAADQRVCLQRMALDRLEALDQERADVRKQITVLRSHPDVASLDEAKGELASFDAAAYREAERHIVNASRLAGLRGHLRQLREQAAASMVTLAAAQAEYEHAKRSWQETGVARQHLKAATELDIELGNLARDCDRAIADVARLEADLERIENERRTKLGGIGGLGRRRDFKRLADQVADVDRRLDAARTRRREAERTLSSFSRQVNVQIEAHLRAAEPITHDVAARLRIAFSAAEKLFRHAWDAQQECIKQSRAVEGQIEHAQRQPQPTAADFDTAARAQEQELAGTLARLPELETKANHVRGEIQRLEERDTELVNRLIQESRTICGEIVREAQVVATTLGMVCVTPELNERDYDHVLIAEAEAARLPEIVHAVSRATKGATLLGDFHQDGPTPVPGFETSTDPAIERWLHQDCFAIFGIHDPESAKANQGCVTLSQQGDP